MMIKQVFTLALLMQTWTYAATVPDQDLDGVPDSTDKCPNTPFLNEVNAQGCTTIVLRLPEETESDSLVLKLKYGFSTNEDLVGRERQNTSQIQLSYHYNNWSYSVRTGHYTHNDGDGILDTSLKIKRKIKLSDKLKLGLGLGAKLPSYDFTGNKTDFTLYSSLSYYPTSSLSLFEGFSHTFIQDEHATIALQNTNSFYMGIGYFFSNDFYANLSFGYSQSKFTNEHAAKSLGSIVYYQINKKYFTTLSYSQEVDDDDLHNSLNFKIGYKIW